MNTAGRGHWPPGRRSRRAPVSCLFSASLPSHQPSSAFVLHDKAWRAQQRSRMSQLAPLPQRQLRLVQVWRDFGRRLDPPRLAHAPSLHACRHRTAPAWIRSLLVQPTLVKRPPRRAIHPRRRPDADRALPYPLGVLPAQPALTWSALSFTPTRLIAGPKSQEPGRAVFEKFGETGFELHHRRVGAAAAAGGEPTRLHRPRSRRGLAARRLLCPGCLALPAACKRQSRGSLPAPLAPACLLMFHQVE